MDNPITIYFTAKIMPNYHGVGSEVGTLSGAHFENLSDCVLDVLAYLLQRDVDVLGGIIGHSPAAALLGVRVLVAEDCPPCNHLAVLVLETVAVNTHAAALAHLVVIHCVLRPADAA